MELTCRYTHADNRIGKLTFDNLPKGTARPIGNALRRALLSEIEGIAVTAVKISGATHGFDTIDGVKEDVTALTANLRQLELRLYSCRKKQLTIDTQQRHVTALDIDGDADVEILNPQQPIATLNPGATLRMQIEIQKGRGFHQERDSSGLIPIPANFSPIKRVGYSVDAAEDGNESLVMEITTNGTISPVEATSQATEILIKSIEDSKVSGAFNGNAGTFKLEPNVGNLLNGALKWALLSYQNGRDNRPVLEVVCSHSEIEIRTDGSIAPKVVLETSLTELREKFTSMKVALQNAQCELESAKSEERELHKKPIRFGDVRSVEDMPDLLAFQRNSYKKFIEFDLPEVLSEIFPVVSYDGRTSLEVLGHELDADAKTDATPLILSFRLNTDGGKKTEEFQVSVGDIPLMKADGTFIIQGVKRVGVSQLHRSPGANFGKTAKQTTARIIPYRGAWMEFEIHTNGTQVHVRMDRREALPATAILRAYGVETNEEIIALFADMDEDEKELIQKTLQADATSSKEEALLEIYRKMHPGETAELDTATNRFEKMFGDPGRYDLSKVGRRQLNRKLELNVSGEERCLRLEDVVAVMRRLLQVHCGHVPVDDIASLTERRVRSIGELMLNQLRLGLLRMARHAREKLTIDTEDSPSYERLSPLRRGSWRGLSAKHSGGSSSPETIDKLSLFSKVSAPELLRGGVGKGAGGLGLIAFG
ncbi:hypothetical protein IH992_30005 [Candidatus Poribacteria bacterium]|nr:hypothetical protein [Candidatus Poribacteria bacterium]